MRPRFICPFLLLLWTAPVLAEVASSDRAPQATSPGADQVWLISTRDLPWYGDQAAHVGHMSYRRCDDGEWLDSTHAEFMEGNDPSVPTCILVHGGPASREMVERVSLSVYDELLRYVPPGRPVRFVIWSWPADRHLKCTLREFRDQAFRSSVQSYYLAWFVDQLQSDVRVSVVGYSLGTRVVSGALELLDGGRVDGCPRLQRQTAAAEPLAVLLLAGAIDSYALEPGGQFGGALSQVSRMVVTVNGCDPLLKRYPKLHGLLRRCPQALGYAGACTGSRLHAYDYYEEIDVSQRIGSSHDIDRYFEWPELMADLAAVAFFQGE